MEKASVINQSISRPFPVIHRVGKMVLCALYVFREKGFAWAHGLNTQSLAAEQAWRYKSYVSAFGKHERRNLSGQLP